MVLITVLVFLSVSLAAAGVFVWLMPTRSQERLRGMAAPSAGDNWSRSVAAMAGPLARLSTPEGEWDTSPLRLRFLHAGVRHPQAPVVYFALKTVLPLLFAGVAWVTLRGGGLKPMPLLLAVLVAALVGCYLPNMLLSWAERRRQREIFESFPDAADLMLVCVEAGLGLDAGLAKVAEEVRRKSVALAEELHLTNLEMRAGAAREKSLRNLALRTGVEEIATFGAMLTQADRFGTSIGDALRVFSDDLRHKRQVRAEEAAAKAPTKMLFPLVMCIFPSIVMVVLGPAIIQIVRTVLPMLGAR